MRSLKTYNKYQGMPGLIESIGSIDDSVINWNKLFSDIANEDAPLENRRINDIKVPWMNPTITSYINDSDFHRKEANINKEGYHWGMCKKYRNLANREIKEAKSKYSK